MTKKPQEVIFTQEENPIPVEILAEHIKAISEGVKTLMAGPLNEKAIVLLIQHAIPGTAVKVTDIRAVIRALERLETTYLKK